MDRLPCLGISNLCRVDVYGPYGMFFAQNAREQKVKGNKITCLVNKCTCYESDAMVQRPKKTYR